jgi:hypothetical protein
MTSEPPVEATWTCPASRADMALVLAMYWRSTSRALLVKTPLSLAVHRARLSAIRLL